MTGAVRRAVNSDIPEIIDLLGEVLRVHNAARPDLFKPSGSKYSEKELTEIIHDDERPVFVYADDSGKILGHCFCIVEDRPETGACRAVKTVYIDDLCVAAEARRRHVGKALYEFVKAFARDIGAYNITLHAWQGNAGAIEFYRRLGLSVQQYTLEEVLGRNEDDI